MVSLLLRPRFLPRSATVDNYVESLLICMSVTKYRAKERKGFEFQAWINLHLHPARLYLEGYEQELKPFFDILDNHKREQLSKRT